MADFHLTRDLLRAAAMGQLSPRVLARIGLEHLLELCPHCRTELEAWQRERQGVRSTDYSRVFELLPGRLAEHAEGEAREARRARKNLDALLALPRDERAKRLEHGGTRFRGLALSRLLLVESEERIRTDPDEAYHLAELARLVAHGSPAAPGAFDVIALATAFMGNALRAAGRLREAERPFGHVRYLTVNHPVTDTSVLARLSELEGSLRKDQRLFREAEELLERSAMLYRLSSSPLDIARVLLNLADVSYYQGVHDEAVTRSRQAISHIPRSTEPRVYLCAVHNLAIYLTEAGRFEEAERITAQEADLYRQFPDAWTTLRLSWLRGKIAAGVGDPATAEDLFRSTREGFIEEGRGFPAAMVSLDLALLYLRAGRTDDVKRLAEEMFPIFRAQDVHREAASALVLFQDAARREELTLQVVHELAAYLRAAQADPSFRFREGS